MAFLRTFLWPIAGLSLCAWFVAHFFLQPAPPAPTRPNTKTAIVSVRPPAVATPAKSPVDLFRELLALDDAEREQRLASRTPESRRSILAKLQEYESLNPEERELRLSTTQLHWYLLPLMKTPPADRLAQLSLIPEADRKMVEDRLMLWDILPPPLQKEVMEYEITRRYFTAGNFDTNNQRVAPRLPENKRKEMEESLARWNALPQEERRRMTAQFNNFFELTPREKAKTLSNLSEPERQQMGKTLQSFQDLPKIQREQCILSFGKFANMTSRQQEQFLRNAERWREMLPSERKVWRQLVQQIPEMPPLPPGLEPRLTPPAPINVPSATNSNH